MRILKSALTNIDGSGGPSALSDPDGQIIDWAFAGKTHTREITNQKTSSADGGGGGGGGEDAGPCKHSVWEHWIDSKATSTTMTTTPSPDEGDMYTLANGDVLERGKQTDPITGKEWEYEELWTDLKIESIPGERNALEEEEGEEEEEEESKRVSVVIKAENVHGEAIGLIVRVGGWVQGVLRYSNGTLEVERWCWKKGDKEEEGKWKGKGAWKCVFRVGYNGIMPCHMTFGEALGLLKEGQGLPGSGGMWTVVEICRW